MMVSHFLKRYYGVIRVNDSLLIHKEQWLLDSGLGAYKYPNFFSHFHFYNPNSEALLLRISSISKLLTTYFPSDDCANNSFSYPLQLFQR